MPGGGKGRVVAAGAAAAAVVDALTPVGSLEPEVVLSEGRPVPIAAVVDVSFSDVSILVGGSGGGAGACFSAIGVSATTDVGCNRKLSSCRVIGATGEGKRDRSSTGTKAEPGSDTLSLVRDDVTV